MDDDAFELAYDDIDDMDLGRQEDIDENIPPPVDEETGVLPQGSNATNQAFKKSNLPPGKDPIDWYINVGNDHELEAKRRKIIEEELVMTSVTQRIEEARRRRKIARGGGDSLPKGDTLENNQPIDNCKSKLLKYPPLTGAGWMGVSCPWNNNRRYIALKNRKNPHKKEKTPSKRLVVAQTNFYEMLEEVRASMKQKKAETKNSTLICQTEKFGHHELWIAKHMPKSFLELLTDDETNRLALLWLKLWDEHIFGRKFRYDSLDEKVKKVLEHEEAKPNLPKFKILMLHGPPGSGKSVLATTVAKQAGYSPFHINIHEIQNLADLKRRIMDVCNFRTIDHFRNSDDAMNKRPKCILIDGIEFATSDCIKYLAQLASKSDKSTQRKPIICTCNSLYALNLKELRPVCLTLKTNLASKERIIKRLSQICHTENITIDSVTLEHLIECCRMDVRLALNTLQFRFQNYTRSRKSASDVQDESIKFAETSTFEFLDAILTLNFHMDKRGMSRTVSERCKTIQHLIAQRDDLERFMFIIFQNLSIQLQLNMDQFRLVNENFVMFDMTNKFIYAHQCYQFFKYLYVFISRIHLLSAVHTPKRINYNLNVQSVMERAKEFSHTLNSICDGHGKSICHLTKSDLVLTTLPLLLPIIQSFQPVNAQVFSKKDLQIISKIVALMAGYGLNYVQKYENNVADLHFDPGFDSLVCFPSENKQVRLQDLPFATKKFIAQQIESYKIRGCSGNSRLQSNFLIEQMSGISDEVHENESNSESNFGFNYNQGSSQATRRNIRMDTLFFK